MVVDEQALPTGKYLLYGMYNHLKLLKALYQKLLRFLSDTYHHLQQPLHSSQILVVLVVVAGVLLYAWRYLRGRAEGTARPSSRTGRPSWVVVVSRALLYQTFSEFATHTLPCLPSKSATHPPLSNRPCTRSRTSPLPRCSPPFREVCDRSRRDIALARTTDTQAPSPIA